MGVAVPLADHVMAEPLPVLPVASQSALLLMIPVACHLPSVAAVAGQTVLAAAVVVTESAVVATIVVSVVVAVTVGAAVAVTAAEAEIPVAVPEVSLSSPAAASVTPPGTAGTVMCSLHAVVVSAVVSPAVFSAELQYDLTFAAGHLAETSGHQSVQLPC